MFQVSWLDLVDNLLAFLFLDSMLCLLKFVVSHYMHKNICDMVHFIPGNLFLLPSVSVFDFLTFDILTYLSSSVSELNTNGEVTCYEGVNASMDSTIADVIPSSDTIELKKDAEQEDCPFWWARSPEKMLQQDTYLALAAAFLILRLLYLLFPKIISFAKRAWKRHTLYANLMNVHEYFFTYLEQGRQTFNRVYPSKQGNLHEGARNATAWASKSLASVSIGEPSTSRMNSTNELT